MPSFFAMLSQQQITTPLHGATPTLTPSRGWRSFMDLEAAKQVTAAADAQLDVDLAGFPSLPGFPDTLAFDEDLGFLPSPSALGSSAGAQGGVSRRRVSSGGSQSAPSRHHSFGIGDPIAPAAGLGQGQGAGRRVTPRHSLESPRHTPRHSLESPRHSMEAGLSARRGSGSEQGQRRGSGYLRDHPPVCGSGSAEARGVGWMARHAA